MATFPDRLGRIFGESHPDSIDVPSLIDPSFDRGARNGGPAESDIVGDFVEFVECWLCPNYLRRRDSFFFACARLRIRPLEAIL